MLDKLLLQSNLPHKVVVNVMIKWRKQEKHMHHSVMLKRRVGGSKFWLYKIRIGKRRET